MKEIQENTGKKVQELNKVIEDLKVEVETIKKTQNGGKPGNGKPRKEVRNYRYKDFQQNIGDRRQNLRQRLDIEDTVEEMDTKIKENTKCKKLLTQTYRKSRTR